MSLRKNVVSNLATAMRTRRLSQYQLAEKSGVHMTGLSRIMNHHSEPSLSTCERLARALRLPAEWLVEPPENFCSKLSNNVDRGQVG